MNYLDLQFIIELCGLGLVEIIVLVYLWQLKKITTKFHNQVMNYKKENKFYAVRNRNN